MKSKVLTFLIPALLAAGATHAAEVYNKDDNKLDLCDKVDGLRYFSDSSVKGDGQSYTRLDFEGKTQTDDQLTGYGQWKYNIQTNNTESSKNQSWIRLAFAGPKFAGYGSFDYGHNYGVVCDIEGWTDMPPELGGDSYTNADSFVTGRASGVATYRNTDFFGLVDDLNFTMQYQGNNEGASNDQEGTNNGRDVCHENGDDWGLSATYDLGMGLSAGATYTSSNRTSDQVNHTTAGDDKANAWTTGLRYDANSICLATMYLEIRNMTPLGDSDYIVANEARNLEATAQYQFDFGLCPTVSFLMFKGHDLHVAGGADNPAGVDDKDLIKYADIGATYYFSKNMSICVDYRINLLDEGDSFYTANGISADDIVALGLVYQF